MSDTQRALDKALRALGMRAHSEKEIVDKLERAGFDERTIAEVMAKLTEYNFTNDEDFARQWTQTRAKRGLGPWRISQELRRKGIDTETVTEAVAEIDEEEAFEQAQTLALRQLRRGGDRARKRAYDAMIRRGYDFDMAREALDAALRIHQEETSEEDE